MTPWTVDSDAMSDQFGEAIGAILGLAVGGITLLKMAENLNSNGPVDFTTMGVLFLLAAVVATVLIVAGLISTVTR